METLQQFVHRLRGIVEYPPFSLGGTQFALWTTGNGSLNFASQVGTEAFATRIQIPFPQRDLHIKSGNLAAASA